MYGCRSAFALTAIALLALPAAGRADSVLDLVRIDPRTDEGNGIYQVDLRELTRRADDNPRAFWRELADLRDRPQRVDRRSDAFQLRAVNQDQTPESGLFKLEIGGDPTFPEAVSIGLGGQAMTIYYDDPALADTDDKDMLPLAANVDADGLGAGGGGSAPAMTSSQDSHGAFFWALNTRNANNDFLDSRIRDYRQLVDVKDSTDATFHNTASDLDPPATTVDDLPVVVNKDRNFINPNLVVDFQGSDNQTTTETNGNQQQPSTPNFAVVPVPTALPMGLATMGVIGVAWLIRKRRDDTL